jgi:rubrerythrin
MSLGFNAREVFDIGVQIEVNGKAFYEAAAKKVADAKNRTFFSELADWEAQHIKLFGELRDKLPASAGATEVFDPEGEAAMYLKATADSHVFVTNRDVVGLVAGCRGPAEILDLAITFEKDSVVYYTSMKQAVSPKLGQEKIDRLINEEIRHIGMLARRKIELARG